LDGASKIFLSKILEPLGRNKIYYLEMTKITQAFIFAAGRGERMRPLTDSIPKPLVKINGKAIIDYAIEKLDAISDIKKIIINGFYLADQIEAHIRNLNNPKVIFSRENEKIETGGGLVFAGDKIDLSSPILTINGDVLWQDFDENSDVKNICNAWQKADCDILLGLKKTEDYMGYEGSGDFNFDGKKLTRFFDEKMSHAFVGMQIINPKILEKAPAKCFSMSHFYKEAVGENGVVQRVHAVELAGKYFHIGTVDAIKKTEEKLFVKV
jgi:N-acetyl-alpha-D-muramate 1-phosphate uridylyltransferase